MGIATLDEALRYVRVNSVLAEIDGVPAEAHLGKSIDEVLVPTVACKLRPLLEAALAGERLLRVPFDGFGVKAIIDCIPVAEADGAVSGVALVLNDVTSQRRAELALSTRLRLTEIISELSAGFIELPASDVDRGIDQALAVVGAAFGVDRAFLCIYDEARRSVAIAHEWHNANAPSVRGKIQDHRLGPWITARIYAGEPVVFQSLDELPPDAAVEREQFAQLGTRSLAVLPLSVGGRVSGLVGFSQVRSEHPWAPEVLDTLQLSSEIIANALERKRTDHALRDRLRFEQVMAAASTHLISVAPPRLEAGLGESLTAVTGALGFDRAALWLLDGHGDACRLIHECGAPAVATFEANVPILPSTREEWPLRQLLTGETIIAESEELPVGSSYAARLAADGMNVNIIAPIMVARDLVGVVLFQRRQRNDRPRAELVTRVRIIVELFGSTLARQRAELERRNAYEELSRLKASIEQERDYLRQEVREEHGRGAILGNSAALHAALDALDAVAMTNAAVLLVGESGVGKELFARELHERSRRATGPMVKVNCASIPKELFESEFFGHVRGAFTGAHKDRAGRFELAHGGTLFLDEVGEIPFDLQAKLLRVLQEGELERVGDDRTRRVDVRVVAATNRDLERDVAAGNFRQDLYYRLSVFPIRIPPLRDRRDDIPMLAEQFLATSKRALGRPELALTPTQLQTLAAYDWPGNVRELQHVIERAVIRSRTPPLRIDVALPQPGTRLSASAPTFTETELREAERQNLITTLERSNWRIAGKGGAAELLGLHPSTLRDRLRALGVARKR